MSLTRAATLGIAPPFQGVTLCCPSWQGGCETRPGEAHTTRLTAGLTRFPAGVSWGGIRVMGACIDTGGPSQGACSRKRAALNVSTGAQSSLTTPCQAELLGASHGEEKATVQKQQCKNKQRESNSAKTNSANPFGYLMMISLGRLTARTHRAGDSL